MRGVGLGVRGAWTSQLLVKTYIRLQLAWKRRLPAPAPALRMLTFHVAALVARPRSSWVCQQACLPTALPKPGPAGACLPWARILRCCTKQRLLWLFIMELACARQLPVPAYPNALALTPSN